MVSQTQVYALYKLLETQINNHYNDRIVTIDKQVADIKDEFRHNILKHWNTLSTSLRVESVSFDDSGIIHATLKLPQHDIDVLQSLISQKNELIEEWHETLELLETWKNLALIGKDYLIDPPTLPKKLRHFLDAAVAEVGE